MTDADRSLLRGLVEQWRARAMVSHRRGNGLDHVPASQSYDYG